MAQRPDCIGCGADIRHRGSSAKWCLTCVSKRVVQYRDPEYKKKHARLPQSKARAAAYRKSASGRRNLKSTQLRVKYGITVERYEAMFAAQGGVCAICKQPPKDRDLAVDHCHQTGYIRSLLCNRCNMGVGYFGDHPRILDAAAKYIRDHDVGIAYAEKADPKHLRAPWPE